MPKNKAPKAKPLEGKQTANSTASTEATQNVAAMAKPAAAGWSAALQELSPEEQALEAAKQKKRNEKAVNSQAQQIHQNAKAERWEQEWAKSERKKAQADKKWEAKLSKEKTRAQQEGILEAIESPADGCWYVEVAPKTWKECSGQYFCIHCEKHLNDHTIIAHMESEGHRKKMSWITGIPEAPAGAPPKNSAAPPKNSTATEAPSWCFPCETLEDWQERGADEYLRCIPCGKMCDGQHEQTTAHLEKLELWRYWQQVQKNGYEAPALEYLAYVPWDETNPSGQRGLKCLLCKKWCNDDWSHTGTAANPEGSKEHQKNLRNYGPTCAWWETEVAAVRKKWHPPQQKTFQKPTPAPWATSNNAAEPEPVEAKQDVKLPDGWEAIPHGDSVFYHHKESGTTQWDMPIVSTPINSISDAQLPPGWATQKDCDGDTYYWHKPTNHTQWSKPTEAIVAALDGWLSVKNDRDEQYYYNEKTGETQWTMPGIQTD